MFATNWPLRGPERQSLQGGQTHDIGQFRNSLTLPPTTDYQYVPLTRPSRQDTNISSASSPTEKSRFRALFWPAVAITVPIALLSATLLALVFGYQVHSEASIFHTGQDDYVNSHKAYVLVDFSATRLVFAASFLSTVAPLLASFIMTLWGLVVSAQMREASTSSHFNKLPTPYQLSILVGLCLASMEQLRTYMWYSASRKRRTKLPAIVNKAALMFTSTILLAFAVFVADTALHYLTSTIEFDRIASISQPEQEFGYGISSLCLDMDRVNDNYGFPCTMDLGGAFSDPTRTAKRNEMNRLQSNASSASQIRVTSLSDTAVDVAILIPNPEKLSSAGDFRASTIGIATQCHLLAPSICNMTAIGNVNDTINTMFNCSDNFFGVLGLSPNLTSADGTKGVDPNLSPLAFKPAVNLQWAFFADGDMKTLYNPESWDPNTNQPDDLHVLSDSQLLNPLTLGVAARLSQNVFTQGSSVLTEERNVFNSNNGILDMIMSCTITSYEVDYTWFRSSIQNVTAVKSENGSLLEMYHGVQSYSTATSGGGGYDLQLYLTDAAIAGNDTASFVNTWSNLYSTKVLSLVGAYLTPRTNVQEQQRDTILVAKVPKGALGALIACSLIYTVLGVFLVIAAWKASTQSVKAIAEQLSLAGLTNMAFGEGKNGSPSYMSSKSATTLTPGSGTEASPMGEDYFTKLPRKETRKVRISGTDFRVWV